MIRLPAGCTVNYPVTIDISKLTDDMINWYKSAGGSTKMEEHYDYKGNKKSVTFVQFGKAKYCHHKKDGTNGVRLHFHGDDASAATMFLMTFPDYVETHNMKEHYSLVQC